MSFSTVELDRSTARWLSVSVGELGSFRLVMFVFEIVVNIDELLDVLVFDRFGALLADDVVFLLGWVNDGPMPHSEIWPPADALSPGAHLRDRASGHQPRRRFALVHGNRASHVPRPPP